MLRTGLIYDAIITLYFISEHTALSAGGFYSRYDMRITEKEGFGV